MRIAYELAQAGDPVGAMEFIQVGLDVQLAETRRSEICAVASNGV